MRNLMAQYYDHIGFDEYSNDEHLTILARTNTINWGCRLDVSDCRRKASSAFAAWRSAPFNQE